MPWSVIGHAAAAFDVNDFDAQSHKGFAWDDLEVVFTVLAAVGNDGVVFDKQERGRLHSVGDPRVRRVLNVQRFLVGHPP